MDALFAAIADLDRVHVSARTKAARPLVWEDFLDSSDVCSEDVVAEAPLAEPVVAERAPITQEIVRDDSDVSEDAAELTKHSRAATQIAMGVVLVLFGVLFAVIAARL